MPKSSPAPAERPAGAGGRPSADLDPELRSRLLQEARHPWRGLRRALWLAFTASAGLGLAVMATRLAGGDGVDPGDLLIQAGALVVFAALLWFDRSRGDS